MWFLDHERATGRLHTPVWLALVAPLVLGFAPQVRAATDLYPDIVVRADDLYNHDLVTTVVPGRLHLRFSVGTPNIGEGPLHVYGVLPDNGDGTQNVNQRIFDDAGGYTDRPAGVFVFHPEHGHVHLGAWTEYRIRTILPGNRAGAVLATSGKTSFCLLDNIVFNPQLPNFSPTPVYTKCNSQTQGISVGWVDVYGKDLPDQNIDVTDVPDGTYWLEVEVDPNDEILESDETNNITRIKVTLDRSLAIYPDRFEPNDSRAEVLARTVGAVNSPNLGPTAPALQLDGLTVEGAHDDDWYRIYLAGTGSDGDAAAIFFAHSRGDLDLELYDAAGVRIAASIGVTDSELVSFSGVGPGWFDLRVLGFEGATSPNYSLHVRPPGSDPPTISVLTPPEGDTVLAHGSEAFPVQWLSADAELDPVWVSVYVNASPILDGNQILVPGMGNLDGTHGGAVINSAEVPEGTWWLYCSATDGGGVTGAWSAGTVTFEHVLSAPPRTEPSATSHLQLVSPRPNPFRTTTLLGVALAREDRVRWEILDSNGRLVRVLHDGILSSGPHSFTFDGNDGRGRPLASGVYYSRVTGTSEARSQKILLLR